MKLFLREREKEDSTIEMKGNGLVMVKGSGIPSEHAKKDTKNAKVIYLSLEKKILLNVCKSLFVDKVYGGVFLEKDGSTYSPKMIKMSPTTN